jgi:arylsulfatase
MLGLAQQLPDADNTLFIYIAGDNGASAEGGLEGSTNENLYINGIFKFSSLL